MFLHSLFDLIASAAAFQALRLAHAHWLAGAELPACRPAYGATLVIGALIGAYDLGTANLWLTGLPGIGRSILGALCGAVAAIEIYKSLAHVKGSSGLIFVPGCAFHGSWARIPRDRGRSFLAKVGGWFDRRFHGVRFWFTGQGFG